AEVAKSMDIFNVQGYDFHGAGSDNSWEPNQTGHHGPRGLGAMETGYQRGRIQDESMLYEQRKHDGSLPIVGVNTFRGPEAGDGTPQTIELARATEDEKRSQLDRVHAYQGAHRDEARAALAALKDAARSGENVFAVLMDAARVCSLQQITDAFFEVGGQYRRNV
ncbi:methylmalonyl-CoA mutase family protein, partial [Actinomadura sp. NPDC048032]|uniref:methylmalonyl-CoA mutase family protein n=1 Tax=Actinomadura sp. NPDC048032 TaxID=3155747 RepID=UPI0033F61B28